jgi:hypothetical protein
MCTKYNLENIKERDHLENLGVNGRIILKLISKLCNVRMWTECNDPEQGVMASYCEYSNESLDSVRGQEFLD